VSEPQDIPQPNQEQEAILQRAPYLKAFINHPPEIGANWLDELKPLAEPLEKEIAQKLGNKWWSTTLIPITVMTSEEDIFDKEIGLYDRKKQKPPEHMLQEVVTSLFLIGYEVGWGDAFKFNHPIFKKLSESGLFHYPVPQDKAEGYQDRVMKTVWGVIRAGAFIRFYNDQGNQQQGAKPQTDPFKDFIQGLENVDKLPPKE